MGFREDSVSSLEHNLRAKQIVVYTSSSCSKCIMLKNWLRNRNTDFEEKSLEDVDVMTNLVMRNVVVSSAPALEIEGTFYTEDQIFGGDGSITVRLAQILG